MTNIAYIIDLEPTPFYINGGIMWPDLNEKVAKSVNRYYSLQIFSSVRITT